MQSRWRRLVVRMSEALPEARYEALLAVLRASVLVAGGLFLLTQGGSDDLHPAIAVNLVLGILSFAAAVPLSQVAEPERARAWGRWSTTLDVLLYVGYSAAFHEMPGAGSIYPVFVLVAGPLRWGLAGMPATVLPVVVIATWMPQERLDGNVMSDPVDIALQCLLITLPVILIRSLVMRSGARLRQAEQQFATAFEHASIGMALLEVDLRVIKANRALGVLLGVPAAHLAERHLADAVDPLERAALVRVLRGLTPDTPSTRVEVRLRRPDGGLRWGHVSASLLEGRSGLHPRIVVQVENITERKRSEALLSHAAAHDALTDLPNRTLLITQLEAALGHGEQVAVLFLDLDRFKVVNDGLGHAAGDQLLVQVAHRLRDLMRPEDLVARQGGDEFVVLCRQADEEVAAGVARRVLQALKAPVPVPGGAEVVVDASVGVALAGPGDTATLVLRDADTAMYAAKGSGGGRVRFFTPEMREAVVKVHELEVDLRAAVRLGGLSLFYQPVVDLAKSRVTSCEALVRWHHPTRGWVPPLEFIDVAEQSDLVLELGEWVLRQAVADASTWPAPVGGAAPSVAVNVSLRQLLSTGFASTVSTVLTETGFPAERLCLEVTETALAVEVEAVVAALEELREVGVRLAIDDFGTGHASLTYLARFPVDQVKVDRSFVAGLGADAGSAAIVGGVIAMAHTFDLRVVAEGVETEGQLAILRELGADTVQGYLMARPVPAGELQLTLPARVRRVLVPAPRAEQSALLRDTGYDDEHRFRLLIEGAREITGRLDLQAVLDYAFEALGKVVSFSGGSILLVEDEQVRIAAAMPKPTPEALAARIPLGQGVSGTIAVTGEPRYLPDITIASTVTAQRRKRAASEGVRSWYGVPLIAEGRPIGVLQVDSTELDAFDDDDRLAVLSFAPVVSLAVVTARHAAAQLEQIQQGTHPS